MAFLLRRLAATIAAVALGATTVATAAPARATVCDTTTQLTVLSFNDFHGRIAASAPDTVRFAGTIEEYRAQAGEANSLVVSAGDSIGASLFASFIDGDKPTMDLLKALQIDASAVGNHEFDGGFTRLRDEVIPRGGYPYLAANVYAAGTQKPLLPEYVIMTKAGLKVAVVGAVTRDTPAMVSPEGVAGLDFGDPVEAVNRTIAQLKDGDQANGEADVIIVAYHEGAPGLGSLEQDLAASAVFARMVHQTDRRAAVILNGHTHQTYAYQAPVSGGGTRPVLQSGSYAARLGRTVLTVDARTGASCSSTSANLDLSTTPVDTLVARHPRAAAAKRVVDAALTHATQIGAQPIGTATAAITRSRAGQDRGHESAASNAVAQMFFDVLSAGNPNFIGIQNPGGTRADIDAGEITYAEAAAVLPFANTLMTTKITGAQLKTVLEQQWQRDRNGVPLATGRQFLRLGLSRNVSYTYDESRPLDQRITSISVNGAPVDPAATYTVGSGSFLITGGDNFWELAKGTERSDTGKADLESWVAWVRARSPLSPDFSLRGVSLSPYPNRIAHRQPVRVMVGAPRGPLALDTLDLTSAGTQPSTTLTASIGQAQVGTTPVSQGRAELSIQIPDTVPTGPAALVLTVAPAQTRITVPITVADPAPGAFTATAPTRILDTRAGASAGSRPRPGDHGPGSRAWAGPGRGWRGPAESHGHRPGCSRLGGCLSLGCGHPDRVDGELPRRRRGGVEPGPGPARPRRDDPDPQWLAGDGTSGRRCGRLVRSRTGQRGRDDCHRDSDPDRRHPSGGRDTRPRLHPDPAGGRRQPGPGPGRGGGGQRHGHRFHRGWLPGRLGGRLLPGLDAELRPRSPSRECGDRAGGAGRDHRRTACLAGHLAPGGRPDRVCHRRPGHQAGQLLGALPTAGVRQPRPGSDPAWW